MFVHSAQEFYYDSTDPKIFWTDFRSEQVLLGHIIGSTREMFVKKQVGTSSLARG